MLAEGARCGHYAVVKWLTREWHRGDLSDAEGEAVLPAYRKHLAEIADRLPDRFRVLAEAGGSVTLHDGRFVLAGTTGPDLQLNISTRDYSFEPRSPEPLLLVHLCYRNFELVNLSLEQFLWRALEPRTEILYCEADALEDGRFEHRMLLWPDWGWAFKTTGWFGIRCSTIDVAVVRLHDGVATPVDPSAPDA